jgi:hypothetical protein
VTAVAAGNTGSAFHCLRNRRGGLHSSLMGFMHSRLSKSNYVRHSIHRAQPLAGEIGGGVVGMRVEISLHLGQEWSGEGSGLPGETGRCVLAAAAARSTATLGRQGISIAWAVGLTLPIAGAEHWLWMSIVCGRRGEPTSADFVEVIHDDAPARDSGEGDGHAEA